MIEALDYETLTSYSLTVKVADGAATPVTATSVITVTVTDVNDNTPTCSTTAQVFNIDETSSNPTTVTQMSKLNQH